MFHTAWATEKADMWVPLMAYREVIAKLARRYQWSQVAMYDRRFRQEAAGKDEVKWEKVNMDLLLDLVHDLPQSKVEAKPGPSSNNRGGRRQESRRRDGGVCYRFNKGEKCVYAEACRFSHMCSKCGGEHPMTQCKGVKN